jgi:hypothetical protein
LGEFQVHTNLTNEALDTLAQKLDEFAQVLSQDEQAMLLTIFKLGSNALNEVGEQIETESGGLSRSISQPITSGIGGRSPILLSESLKSAFRPAIARGLNGINVAASGVEVTGGVKWSA